MKYRPKHIIEYLAVRLLVGALRVVPEVAAIGIGCGFAWVIHYLARFQVLQARARIREIFPGRFSPAQVRKIAWVSWRNFILAIVDMARLRLVDEEWFKRHVDGYAEIEANVVKFLPPGRGAVIAMSHMGSWELWPTVLRLKGMPAFYIVTRQKNPLVDGFLNDMRRGDSETVLHRGSRGIRSAIRRLQRGDKMGILPDVRVPREAITVRLMGREANVGGGMAAFARQAGVPILPVIPHRVGLLRHSAKVYPLILPDPGLEKHADVIRMTQLMFDRIGDAITASPEQWFWFNKRWIFDPVDRSRPSRTEGVMVESKAS